MTFHSHNSFHLGDNIVHLHWLRAMARQYPEHQFVHAIEPCHLEALWPLIEDVGGLHLIDLADRPEKNSRDVWKNAGRFWEFHPARFRYSEFYLQWFQHLAREMKLESPFTTPRDLLFDYAALPAASLPWDGNFDFLVVNSQPCSGQFRAFDRVEYFDPLIEALCVRGYKVITTAPTQIGSAVCTREHNLSVTQIGKLSLLCPYIVMVSTGPSWPTFNIWNTQSVKLRVVCLDAEQLDLPGGREQVQVANLDGCFAALKQRGLL